MYEEANNFSFGGCGGCQHELPVKPDEKAKQKIASGFLPSRDQSCLSSPRTVLKRCTRYSFEPKDWGERRADERDNITAT